MGDALTLRGVQIDIARGRTILGPIDLEVAVGEHWVVLGPNGGGKTTLLTLAGTMRHPSRGEAWVLGEQLGRTDIRRLRERIGHVSHAIADRIRPSIEVLDVVLTGRGSMLETWFHDFTEADHGYARALLDEFGCGGLAGQAFAACSQGERQRVLLARARFARHELLLLDEPAAGLDLPGRESLLRAIEGYASVEDGPTTILVTHHLEEIPAPTTHAALLRQGQIVASGPIEEALTDATLSATFDMGLRVGRTGARWSAIAA
ncbi:MAG: ATP-binding cassette domain-containing protein [Actinomycetota bacterium]